MSYAIIGFGAVGQALATMFARRGIEVAVASRRSPEALASQASAIGPKVVPGSLDKALEADTLLLAVPFWEHRVVAKGRASWQDKIVIDVTNAYGVPVEDLGGLPSSAVIARALPRRSTGQSVQSSARSDVGRGPAVDGGRRVIFVSSDDDAAATSVHALAEQLGFAPGLAGKACGGRSSGAGAGQELGASDLPGPNQEGVVNNV